MMSDSFLCLDYHRVLATRVDQFNRFDDDKGEKYNGFAIRNLKREINSDT